MDKASSTETVTSDILNLIIIWIKSKHYRTWTHSIPAQHSALGQGANKPPPSKVQIDTGSYKLLRLIKVPIYV